MGWGSQVHKTTSFQVVNDPLHNPYEEWNTKRWPPSMGAMSYGKIKFLSVFWHSPYIIHCESMYRKRHRGKSRLKEIGGCSQRLCTLWGSHKVTPISSRKYIPGIFWRTDNFHSFPLCSLQHFQVEIEHADQSREDRYMEQHYQPANKRCRLLNKATSWQLRCSKECQMKSNRRKEKPNAMWAVVSVCEHDHLRNVRQKKHTAKKETLFHRRYGMKPMAMVIKTMDIPPNREDLPKEISMFLAASCICQTSDEELESLSSHRLYNPH